MVFNGDYTSLNIVWNTGGESNFNIETSPEADESGYSWSLTDTTAFGNWTDYAISSFPFKCYRISITGGGATNWEVVGFCEVEVDEGMNLSSIPFKQYDTELDKVIGEQLIATDTDVAQADLIQYWETSLQQYYYAFRSTASGYEGWRDPDTWEPAEFGLDEGDGFWVKVRDGHGPEEILLAGEVSPGYYYQVEMVPGWQIFGNIYPLELGFDEADIPAQSSAYSPAGSDIIRSWDNGWEWYEGAFLCTAPGYEGWRDTETFDPVTFKFTPGKGYWMNIREGHFGFQWDFQKPQVIW